MRSVLVGMLFLGGIWAGCTAEDRGNEDVGTALLADPCVQQTSADSCGAEPSGVCTWLEAGEEAGCASTFGLIIDENGGPLRLRLPERDVTHAQLAESGGLTESEKIVAAEHAADMLARLRIAVGLDAEENHHDSGYCGHGTSGNCWVRDVWQQSIQVCGSPLCHYHEYDHESGYNCSFWSTYDTSWRACP